MIEPTLFDYLLAGFIGGLTAMAIYTLTKLEKIEREIKQGEHTK